MYFFITSHGIRYRGLKCLTNQSIAANFYYFLICGIDENKSRVIEKIIDYIRLISKYAHERKKENGLLLLYITRRGSYIRK